MTTSTLCITPQFKYMKVTRIVYRLIQRFIVYSLNDYLLVSLIAQLLEFCTGIAEVRVQFPLVPEFSGLLLYSNALYPYSTCRFPPQWSSLLHTLRCAKIPSRILNR